MVTKKRSENNSPKKVSAYASSASYKNDRSGYLNGALAKTRTTSKATGAELAQKRDGKRKAGPLIIGKSFSGLEGLGQDIETNRMRFLPKSKGKKVIARSMALANLANSLSKEV